VQSQLSFRDLILALLVILVWGVNFAVIRIGLNSLPPLLFASLRFTLVLLPMVFFLPRPRSVRASGSDPEYVPWSNLAFYGLAIGLGQFGLLFIAMDGMISPGLASLVIQMQAFFTIALSMICSHERLRPYQLMAFALALAGMGVIMAHNGKGATILGLVLTLGAAASWALANQASKEAGKVNALAYVVWASMFSLPPLYLLSLWREGWPAIAAGVSHAGWGTWAVILYQSAGNTMFGYGVWAWLHARYPAATVAPLSLLVPVVGFAASALILGEPLQAWKIGAGVLVLAGLAVNLFWGRRADKFAPVPQEDAVRS
jgi:O-acetylserine/cysteine efflux transporter